MVRFHRGFSITTAYRGDSSPPGFRCGRPLLPNSVRTFATSSRDRVRSSTVLNNRSITAPEANTSCGCTRPGDAADVDLADRLGVAIHEAERDDRGELGVGGLVDERDRLLNARLQLGWAGFAERERGVVIENAAVDADPGGVDGGDRGLRADGPFGAARRAALLAIRHRRRPGRS